MANQCEQLARLLSAEGVTVEVVRNNPDYRPAWIGRMPVLRAFARLLPYLIALWRGAGRAEVMHVLANSGWAFHLFAAPAVWIARLRGCPVIVNYRGGHADTFFASAPGHVFRTLRAAGARVTPSAFLQRVFAQHALDAEVVPNIIDLARFKAVTARDFGTAPHLVVTRNLEPIYDIATAIEAFVEVRKVFRDARLTVAGTGPERDRLLALSERLGVVSAVTFCGRIDNADIPALYASADCMLNPSTIDNMPISILEALASAVPVVSTDAGGIPDMVDHGVSALLVPIGNPTAMAREAVRILTNRPLADALRAAGLAAISSYSWPCVRDQWFAIYRRLATPRKAAAVPASRAGRVL
jgi:glycosyltransferase involved in cell wall biosynthesis